MAALPRSSWAVPTPTLASCRSGRGGRARRTTPEQNRPDVALCARKCVRPAFPRKSSGAVQNEGNGSHAPCPPEMRQRLNIRSDRIGPIRRRGEHMRRKQAGGKREVGKDLERPSEREPARRPWLRVFHHGLQQPRIIPHRPHLRGVPEHGERQDPVRKCAEGRPEAQCANRPQALLALSVGCGPNVLHGPRPQRRSRSLPSPRRPPPRGAGRRARAKWATTR